MLCTRLFTMLLLCLVWHIMAFGDSQVGERLWAAAAFTGGIRLLDLRGCSTPDSIQGAFQSAFACSDKAAAVDAAAAELAKRAEQNQPVLLVLVHPNLSNC